MWIKLTPIKTLIKNNERFYSEKDLPGIIDPDMK